MDLWLTLIVARLAGLSTMAEREEGELFSIQMYEGFQKTSALMHLSLSGSAAKDAVLRDLASRTLTLENRTRFDALFKSVRSIRKRRNDIVHGLWGFDPSIPDGLVLQKLEDAVVYALTPDKHVAYVYREDDFVDLIREIQILNGKLASFRRRI